MDQDKRLIVAGTLVGLPLLAFVWKTIFPSHPLYPPGPKQHPILGNLRDFPKVGNVYQLTDTFSNLPKIEKVVSHVQRVATTLWRPHLYETNGKRFSRYQ